MATKKVKAEKPANPVGRPTKYKPEYPEQARKLCLLGHTDAELATFFGVNEDTIHEWKVVHPEFSESICLGKEIADADIAESLYHRAKGYSHPDVDIKVVQNQIVETTLVKHYPPDTTAASLWLRNRQSGKWRDKVEVDHSGKVGFDAAPVEELTGALNELLAKLK
jgi:hypothetical protein